MGLRGEAAASPGGGTVDISVSAAPWQHGEQRWRPSPRPSGSARRSNLKRTSCAPAQAEFLDVNSPTELSASFSQLAAPVPSLPLTTPEGCY